MENKKQESSIAATTDEHATIINHSKKGSKIEEDINTSELLKAVKEDILDEVEIIKQRVNKHADKVDTDIQKLYMELNDRADKIALDAQSSLL